ncbi:WD40-repeat-containing domain protein [Mycena filopes]|nr:WD40-repeat-containing domain protein [Mycena filopes]
MDLAGLKENSWKDVRRRLASVMQSSPDTLRFQHSTFIDFLTLPCESTDCPEDFHIPVKDCKKRRSLALLARLQDGLCFNICRLDTSYWFNSTHGDLEDKRKKHIPLTLLYCCRYWSDHLDSSHGDPEILEALRLFLTTKFLYWAEVLSLFKDSADGNGPLWDYTLSRLQFAAEWARTNQSLAQFLQDGIAFLTEFRDPIQASTPHIYVSALPFTRPTSEVYKTFKSHFPGTASVVRGPPHAPASTTTKEITAVLFLPGGLIASASTDHVIRLWDATTGAPLLPLLSGHQGKINSLAYSNGGSTLASGSDDTTVRVWTVKTGGFVEFQGHTDAVTSVAFPPSGKYVISASKDGTLRFWDPVSRGIYKVAITTNQGPINAVTFLDEEHFTTGAQDGSYRITFFKVPNSYPL